MIRDIALLMAQGIPFEQVLDLEGGEDKFFEIKDLLPFIERFYVFMMAKSLGIRMEIRDISFQDLQVFSLLHAEIQSTAMKGMEKNGG